VVQPHQEQVPQINANSLRRDSNTK
jgi:hypothetical protein